MGQPFIGEIRMFAGTFAPLGWMFCEGQELAIAQNDVLFQLLGTRYGGDGQSTFRLPDLRGRVPMHTDSAVNQGEKAGVESVTLSVQQIPTHTHTLVASTNTGTLADAGNNVHGRSSTPGVFLYQSSESPDVTLHPNSVAPAGGSQPHENIQPCLALNFIISLFGVYPSPT